MTEKEQRALARLAGGQALFLLPGGQWKFGGNKFVPASVVRRLPIEESHTTNRGWVAHTLTEEAQRVANHKN